MGTILADTMLYKPGRQLDKDSVFTPNQHGHHLPAEYKVQLNDLVYSKEPEFDVVVLPHGFSPIRDQPPVRKSLERFLLLQGFPIALLYMAHF